MSWNFENIWSIIRVNIPKLRNITGIQGEVEEATTDESSIAKEITMIDIFGGVTPSTNMTPVPKNKGNHRLWKATI